MLISILIPVASALLGVLFGAWLSERREIRQRKFAFIESQLRDFYSPLLGIRSEIRARSELCEKIQNTADTTWKNLIHDKTEEEARKLSDERLSKFEKIIEYDNRQLREELVPAYRKMVDLFKDSMWLAEPETKKHFKPLLEFVELWERHLDKSIPFEIIQALGHGEESLHTFYDHLQKKHDELREKLEKGYI